VERELCSTIASFVICQQIQHFKRDVFELFILPNSAANCSPGIVVSQIKLWGQPYKSCALPTELTRHAVDESNGTNSELIGAHSTLRPDAGPRQGGRKKGMAGQARLCGPRASKQATGGMERTVPDSRDCMRL
jgi:hypothetical protein